jgi:hypothetical protein
MKRNDKGSQLKALIVILPVLLGLTGCNLITPPSEATAQNYVKLMAEGSFHSAFALVTAHNDSSYYRFEASSYSGFVDGSVYNPFGADCRQGYYSIKHLVTPITIMGHWRGGSPSAQRGSRYVSSHASWSFWFSCSPGGYVHQGSINMRKVNGTWRVNIP